MYFTTHAHFELALVVSLLTIRVETETPLSVVSRSKDSDMYTTVLYSHSILAVELQVFQ